MSLINDTLTFWGNYDKILNCSQSIYLKSKSDFTGAIPIRQDVTVLPADNSRVLVIYEPFNKIHINSTVLDTSERILLI